MLDLLTDRDVERFWSKVDKTATCWLWTGNLSFGYGTFPIRSNGKPRHLRAHRVSFLLGGLEIPDGLVLDHLCRVLNCVNPEHLRAVTNRVNVLAGIGPSALNAAKTHCPQGHAYDVGNTRIGSKGDRKCRACDREAKRKRDVRRKATRVGPIGKPLATECPHGHAYTPENTIWQ